MRPTKISLVPVIIHLLACRFPTACAHATELGRGQSHARLGSIAGPRRALRHIGGPAGVLSPTAGAGRQAGASGEGNQAVPTSYVCLVTKGLRSCGRTCLASVHGLLLLPGRRAVGTADQLLPCPVRFGGKVGQEVLGESLHSIPLGVDVVARGVGAEVAWLVPSDLFIAWRLMNP